MEKPSVTGKPHLGGRLMISSRVHHGKSHADMSKRQCLGARMQMASTAKGLFIKGITISSRRCEGGPNTTARPPMTAVEPPERGFVLKKVNDAFSPSVSDQASVSLECNCKGKRERNEKN